MQLHLEFVPQMCHFKLNVPLLLSIKLCLSAPQGAFCQTDILLLPPSVPSLITSNHAALCFWVHEIKSQLPFRIVKVLPQQTLITSFTFARCQQSKSQFNLNFCALNLRARTKDLDANRCAFLQNAIYIHYQLAYYV